MKMLSEMECREALDDIYVLAIPCQEEVFEHRSQYLKERYILIKQLIKEHFDPQPYTFRELNKGMWIWDDKEKSMFSVQSYDKYRHGTMRNLYVILV